LLTQRILKYLHYQRGKSIVYKFNTTGNSMSKYHFNKILLLLCVFTMHLSPLNAQTPDLETEIKEHKSQRDLLIQGRYMLLDSLEAGKTEKAIEVREYLMGLSEDLLPFLPNEHFFILYWTREFDLLEEELRLWLLDDDMQPDGVWRLSPEHSILPQLARWTQKHEEELRTAIDDEVSFGRQNEFLQLFLTHLLRETYGAEAKTRAEINAEATSFLDRYPDSDWATYVRENIRFIYDLSPWFGGFNIGGGFNGLTRDLKNRYGNTGSMDFELYGGYHRFGLAFDAHIGFMSNKNEESYTFEDGFEVTWAEGDPARFYRLSLNSFAHIPITPAWNLIPIAGIGISAIEPTESDLENLPELEVFQSGWYETYNLGAGLQWRFRTNSNQSSYRLGSNYTEHSTFYLQLRYVYSEPQFQRNLRNFEGNYHTLTLSIGGFGRSYRRQL